MLEIQADRLIVISGQVAVDPQGKALGSTVEEQTRHTLENCRRQLETAGCTFDDVFKVNAFLSDIDDWGRFNAVYLEMIPTPRPVRTTVGAGLVPPYLVEIEMWAAKRT